MSAEVERQIERQVLTQKILENAPELIPVIKDRCPGIYFLFLKGEIVYVGQSAVDVHGRVKQHLSDTDKEFDSYTWKEGISEESLEDAEASFIIRLNPRFNYQVPRCTIFQTQEEIQERYKIQSKKALTRYLKSGNTTAYPVHCHFGWRVYYCELAYSRDPMFLVLTDPETQASGISIYIADENSIGVIKKFNQEQLKAAKKILESPDVLIFLQHWNQLKEAERFSKEVENAIN